MKSARSLLIEARIDNVGGSLTVIEKLTRSLLVAKSRIEDLNDDLVEKGNEISLLEERLKEKRALVNSKIGYWKASFS